MSRISLSSPFRSTRARAATLLVCLFVAAFGSSGLATWAALSQPVDEGIETRLRREMGAVLRLYAAHDPNTAARLIAIRERRPAGFQFRVVGADGRRLAGDLPEGQSYDLDLTTIEMAPRAVSNFSDDSDQADEDVGQRIRVLTVAAPSGGLISLGEDLGRTRELKSLFLRTFILTSGAALMVALAAGLSYISRILGRIEAIARTADAVSGEDMGVRAPIRDPARRDDIDRLALSVNQMLDRIAGLLQSVRQVSDDVAHDLRTPLTHLKQRIETALSGPPSVESYRDALEGASEKIDEVLATFEALLSIAQMEAGSPATGAFHPVDLAEVAADVAEAYRPSAEDSGHRLLLHGASAATVQGVRSLITQMLANLVANALIHTPAGATVEIAAERVGEGARLTVQDDGPGVPADLHDQIFRRFFRVERSRTTPGSGLGLSLAAAVASVHGAHIRAEDAQPGLRIVVDFPSPGEHLN